MADQVITKQELIDAQKDAQTLEDVVNGEPNKLVKTRLGREVYTLASVPQINTMTREEVTSALAPKADKTETAAALDTKANQADTFLKSEVTNLVTPKADKTYVDNAVGAISTDASKQYATLDLANADIANISTNKNIFVSEAANGGYWYKATAGATSLTKSPYDPLSQAKNYTDTIKLILDKDISTNKDSSTKLLVAMQELVKALGAESLDLNQKISNVLSSIAVIQSGIVGVNDELTQHLTAIQILVKAIESQPDAIQKAKDSAKDQIVATHLLVQQLNEEKDASSGSGIGLTRGVFKYGETYLKDQVFTHASGTYIALEDVINAQTTPDQDDRYGCISESDGALKVAELSVKSASITTGHPSGEVPHTISPDGMKMWATYSMGKLLESTDFGKTWNQIQDFGDLHRVVWVRQTDNGELLLRTETYEYGEGGLLTDVRQRVRRTVGYGTATMTFETCIDIQNRRNVLFHNGWSISTHKNIIMISEYGAKGDEAFGGTTLPVELSARYAYMSLDYGVTWTTIFDTFDHIADTNAVHIHGICYDPYWERIWINCGDRVSGLWYSDDLGATWTESEYFERDPGGIAPTDKRQNVGIIALPTCVLFGTDYAQDGVHRIDRAHGKHIAGGKYPVDVAHAIEFGQGHTRAQVCHIINHTYQKENAPIIFGFCSETPVAGTAPAGTVVVTYDGWNFKQIWQDALWQPTGKGLQSLAGITLLNEIIIKSVDSRSPTNTYTKITLKV